MGEVIFGVILIIPIYAILIWSYFNPKESLLWGRRWIYQDEPDLSDCAIRYIKVASLVSIFLLTIILGIIILTIV